MNANSSSLPRTILGIPGVWPTRKEIVTSIVQNSGGYLFAGMIMMHIESKAHFQVDVAEHDDQLARAFQVAGGGRIPAEELEQIRDHTFCLYLTADGGSVEAARRFLSAGEALLKCGGLGVKIESSGVGHSVSRWRQLAANRDLESLLKAFVTYVGSGSTFYSCGMHNLGYPDCVVEADVDPPTAANLLHTFLRYLLIENPTIRSGQTFSVDAAKPRYRLAQVESTFDADDPFHNPYGVWKMVPAR